MKHQHRGSEYKALPVAWEDSDPGCTLPELATGYLPVRPMRRGATLRGAHLGRDLLMFSLRCQQRRGRSGGANGRALYGASLVVFLMKSA